jgi:hypothetical protein
MRLIAADSIAGRLPYGGQTHSGSESLKGRLSERQDGGTVTVPYKAPSPAIGPCDPLPPMDPTAF